jgi:pyruvate,water dikinase
MSAVASGVLLDAGSAVGADEALVGGKALGLARLQAAGVRVPEWWVITTGARELTPELIEAVTRIVGTGGAWAVRSSVVGEDSATQSFAGMFDSFVFLEGAAAVVAAIERCWASVSSARALAYRGGAATAPIGVILQRAVAGEVSGVIFTANPVSGRGDEALVSATWGLAEGVVSGRLDTDEFVYGRDGRERLATIAHKTSAIVPAGDGGGTVEAPVPESRRAARSLSERQLADLCRAAFALAESLGAPQDIEWTLARGELHFLQTRPITARASAADPTLRALGGKRIVWDNSNIQESFNGVTTPLTFSVAVGAYASVYEQTLRLLGVGEAQIAAYQPVFRNMIGLVDGRVYYNIESWYRCLLLLPSFDRSKEDMERMMGLEHPVDLVRDVVLSRAERVRRAVRLIPVGVRLALAFRRLERSVARFLQNFDARTAHIDRASLPDADLHTLLTLAERLDREVVGDWTTPIVNDLWCMTTTGRVRKRLIAAGRTAEEADELIAALISGEDGIESMEPTRRLLQMAGRIRDSAQLRADLDAGRIDGLGDDLEEFLHHYGDRCMGEMKLETRSLRQDPSFIVSVLRNYVAAGDLEAHALADRERARRTEAEGRALAGLGPRRRRRLRRAIADARRAVKWRENMRLSRTRFVGLYRDIFLAAGERLHDAGLLDAPRDVLYLTRDELTGYHEGTAVSTDLAGLARLRAREYAAYDRRPGALPNHFETTGGVYAGPRVSAPGVVQTGRVLRGTGCSAGVIAGELRIIESPDDDLDVGGRILTALRTDPGWTPLFPSAAGILVERGSTLSHSAVLAREFGIPAVVGIPGLLETVSDGERVRLDGGAGTVERLDLGSDGDELAEPVP